MLSPKDSCEIQDELGDILRKTEVSFVCIMQTLWQCQVIFLATVPIFVIRFKKMEADK